MSVNKKRMVLLMGYRHTRTGFRDAPRVGRGLATAGLLLLCGWFSAGALAASVMDYAYQAHIEVPAAASQQPLKRFVVPVAVLLQLTRADFRAKHRQADMAVFNAAGQVLPMSLHPVVGETTLVQDPLPFHVFSRYRETGQKTITTRARTEQDNMAAEQATTQTLAVRSKAQDYLIELKPDGSDVTYERVFLRWTQAPQDQLVLVRVESGKQLDQLKLLAANKQLTQKLRDDDQATGITGFKPEDRYLRLTVTNALAQFTLEAVTGIYQQRADRPVLTHAVSLRAGKKADNPVQDKPFYVLDTPWRVQPTHLTVLPDQANRVLTGDLWVLPVGETDPQLIQAGFQQHTLTDERVTENQALELPRRPFAQIQVALDGAADHKVRAQLQFTAWQIVFLGDGGGPYTFAWGRDGAPPAAPNLDKLVHQPIAQLQADALTVALGAARLAGGEEKLRSPSEKPWKTWLLWGLLLLGVIATGAMAWQLYREMKADA